MISSSSCMSVPLPVPFIMAREQQQPAPRHLSPSRARCLNIVLSLLPFLVTFAHVFLSPYTKVEESFTLHAVHDVLAFGFNPHNLQLWDHVTFPGAVPRSFIPPTLLGILVYPFSVVSVASGAIKTKFGVQILVRLLLASLFSYSFNKLSCSLQKAFNVYLRVWFTMLSLSSFHIPYYAGRTLPNFMALPGVLWSISHIMTAQTATSEADRIASLRKAVIALTALATIVRLELALFVVPLALSLLVNRQVGFGQVLKWGILGGVGSLSISSAVDYHLWLPTLSHPSFPFKSHFQLFWPELSGLIYNAVEGHSAEWGVMPWHYYLSSSLPKLLAGNALLVGIAMGGWLLNKIGLDMMIKKAGDWDRLTDVRGVNKVMKVWALSMVTVIGALSFLGHKEWRFILPVLPILHIISALSASSLWSLRPSKLGNLMRLIVLVALGLNSLATIVTTFLSVGNYPGGEVWKVMEDIPGLHRQNASIYFPSYPLQTGATLFTFVHAHSVDGTGRGLGPWSAFPEAKEPRWIYNKSEDKMMENPISVWKSGIDFVVTGDCDQFLALPDKWVEVASVEGLDSIGRVPGTYRVQAKWGRKLTVLQRREDIQR
ncbi:alpha-1,6-mannosyltransferase [Cryptococcus neoformans AD2-60a]|uniref:Mannosyltransferase n=1 Tax=Cryptococcus neoformans Tu259-1 TaxID=1230072 RepID=A0A854QHL5_CRYNE|nr:alpha-1,6-mannosyltransferase [Cryptococcus neoformans var. grubii AD1-83a]OWZ34549.1 alpha-1,6-mannosyltransferase [Cryptococcus neoformans var. grubii AD2-60a]OWZ55756.1 alpha-1,6-mannosyltransferase [Cryptococcus neoformans var. grubii 125.91]OXG25901.1 alpha-1,6-mannosyltransferase [Cryptococcus neoformans var. grubii Tu259-1]OXG34620.1 alpha-1,6-mannosyltransferase [Cryptococcus neoformans var. grubii Bt120]OXG38145.1 alpha-1,6-mannosyltransferase [Cryptococcus neoformans var. grubii B